MRNYLLNSKFVTLTLGITFLIGCTTDSVSDLSPIETINEVSYLRDVKPIIDSKCNNCHGNPPTFGAPSSYTTYENVRTAVLNQGLIDRITRPENTSGAMPLGGPRLSQNEINIIIQWSEEGFAQ
jgi:uncharacterized membrane protein